METGSSRHRYVYAIALHDLGQPREAITQLNSVLRQVPGNEEVLLALVNYHQELGERNKAISYATQLNRVAPTNQNYQQLLQQLSQGQ